MKVSPIQLTDYFLTDLRLSANPKFDAKQEVSISFDNFEVTIEASHAPKSKRDWQICLKLNHQPPAGANVPYRFNAEIVGFLLVHPEFPEDRIERLVKTNGASMLFGALREIIRDSTARGPYSALFLPSTSFYEPETKVTSVSSKAPPAAQTPPTPATPRAASPAKTTTPKHSARKTTGN